MKTLLSIFLAALLGCATMSAGSLTPIFKEFKSTRNCTVVNLPPMMMWMAKLSTSEPIMKKISSMKVLTIENADAHTASKFDLRAKQLGAKLEELTKVKDDDDTVIIWMESKKGKIRTIYVYVIENEGDLVLVEFNGNFTTDDLAQLIDKSHNDTK